MMTYFGQAGVYLLKTKVVIFRNRGNIKSEEKWYLNGESIEICNEFMYLGILLINNERRLYFDNEY
jgi:hypothetical protein